MGEDLQQDQMANVGERFEQRREAMLLPLFGIAIIHVSEKRLHMPKVAIVKRERGEIEGEKSVFQHAERVFGRNLSGVRHGWPPFVGATPATLFQKSGGVNETGWKTGQKATGAPEGAP